MAVAALPGLESPSVLAEPDHQVQPGFAPLGKMPFNVMMAEQALMWDGKPEDAVLYLLMFFVDATDHEIEMARDLGLQQGWNAQMLGVYDKARAKIRPLIADPRNIYDFAWDLAHLAGIEEADPYSWRQSKGLKARTAWYLYFWSSMNGIDEAQFGLARSRLDSGDDIKAGQFYIWNLATKGYGPAIRDLASRYETGNGFQTDMKKAFYWATEGVAAGLALSEQASRLRDLLSAEEVKEVESWRFHPLY